MRRLLPLLVLPFLAACVAGGAPTSPFSRLLPNREPEPPPPLPLAVQAALPPGVPSTIVMQDANGCYLYSIERTDPPSGYPLRDAAGNPICDGALPPVSAVTGAPAALPGSETLVPADPAVEAITVTAEPPATDTTADAVIDEGPIDISPVLDAPLPNLAPGLVPGDITPPAPIAPLN